MVHGWDKLGKLPASAGVYMQYDILHNLVPQHHSRRRQEEENARRRDQAYKYNLARRA